MEESIKDLYESLKINKEMLTTVISSGINDKTLTTTFYKLTEENSKLIKSNQILSKERDVALFKLEKLEFENALALTIQNKTEDVRFNCNAKSVDVKRINTKETTAKRSNDAIDKNTTKNEDKANQKNNQELEEKISKVCERMTVINKHLEDGEDEMMQIIKNKNMFSNNADYQHMSSNNLLKDQGLNFNKSFFSSVHSKDSRSPVPRLNLTNIKYKDKESELKDFVEKLEESVKILRRNLKSQINEFDKLRFKYVKLANQNKQLFDLNERLKICLKETKEKLSNSKST